MSNLPHHDNQPGTGGGIPVIKYWAEKTLSPTGIKLWQTLNHHSACLSCAWGTGGQQGGFVNETGEYLQRCAKSVEAIAAELQAGIEETVFGGISIKELQQLSSRECDGLGRLQYPMILREGSDYYQRLSWEEVYQIAAKAFRQ
ncbi:MAG: oxidoreductase, partial [Symploca sp. SIO1B1]|nr:oxidoreductase [Symploca sp. SIO1B1]